GEGFVAAASQQLIYSANTAAGAGLSWAVELGTPAAASKELSFDYARLAVGGEGAKVSGRFTLAGLPGSRGWVDQALGFYSANLLFPEGRCVMLIGVERTGDVQLASVTGPVEAAARSIFKRTRGACP
ncbi:MAG TPA: hypothetical protein VL977_07070, partial [Solirubrobacteraceae bacterium]|nr:hypothetical protein [Solirubrobacteraceae bacterium]